MMIKLKYANDNDEVLIAKDEQGDIVGVNVFLNHDAKPFWLINRITAFFKR